MELQQAKDRVHQCSGVICFQNLIPSVDIHCSLHGHRAAEGALCPLAWLGFWATPAQQGQVGGREETVYAHLISSHPPAPKGTRHKSLPRSRWPGPGVTLQLPLLSWKLGSFLKEHLSLPTTWLPGPSA